MAKSRHKPTFEFDHRSLVLVGDIEEQRHFDMSDSPACSKPARLTPVQRNALEPIAMVLAGIDESLQNCDRNELLIILDACNSVSETNCWCWTYAAAEFARDRVRQLLNELTE